MNTSYIGGSVFCWDETGQLLSLDGVFVSVGVGHGACGVRSESSASVRHASTN